jgi:hypothetical protein
MGTMISSSLGCEFGQASFIFGAKMLFESVHGFVRLWF